MPITPMTPPPPASATVAGSGNGSRVSVAMATIPISPMIWTTSETPSTGARRLVQPPPKSPVPNATADASPRTTTARFASAASAPSSDPTRHDAGLTPPGAGLLVGDGVLAVAGVARAVERPCRVVELGWAGERDDGIGGSVVAIRRGQVDDLEVARHVAQQLEGPPGALVVERHERVVEDQRRPAVARHEPDQPDPCHEVDEVERALAERRHVDPVAALRRVNPDVEGLVVDLDAAVAALGHPGDVDDHPPLEIARRGLHRVLLGELDLAERPLVDAGPPLEGRELLAPDRELLDVACDRLGVHGVRLDAGAGVRLVVAGPFERRLQVADLDLQPLPCPRLAGDRPEALESVALLLDLERGSVAALGQRLLRLLAHQTVEL